MIVIVLGRNKSTRLKLNVENPPTPKPAAQGFTPVRLWLSAIVALATLATVVGNFVVGIG